MNRVSIMLIAAVVLFSMTLMSVEPPKTADLDLKIGNVRIPRDFIHAGKDYKRGLYFVTLKNKKGVPYFYVHNRKKELLFEELAIIKPYEGKAKKFKFRIKKEMLKGYEYYRLKVVYPEKEMIAFFLIKKKEQEKKPANDKTAPAKNTGEVEQI